MSERRHERFLIKPWCWCPRVPLYAIPPRSSWLTWLCLLQVYKGPEPWFRLPAAQTNCEYRARVCAGRQCHDLPGCPELYGPYSPSAVFCCQRREPGPAAAPAGAELAQSGKRLHEERVIAIALLCGFAVVAILFAVVIQYFVIK